MDARIEEMARTHDGVVATWKLCAGGVHPAIVMRAVRDMQRLHDGVYLAGALPATPRQRHRAATMTAPGTTLTHASAGASLGMREHHARFETVTRPGSGGPRRVGDLLVMRSTTLAGEIIELDGLPVTRPERTALDLAPHVGERELHRLLREAIRVGLTTADALRHASRRYRGRRGNGRLTAWLDVNAHLPFERCRSDAEARALEILHAAGIATPAVNVRRAGIEADLSWPDRRLIVEIDGAQWHSDAREDARKTAVWRRAGWRVVRVPSHAVYDDPARLIAAARS